MEVFDDTGRRYAATTNGRATVLAITEVVNRAALEERLRSSHDAVGLRIDDSTDFVLAFADAFTRRE